MPYNVTDWTDWRQPADLPISMIVGFTGVIPSGYPAVAGSSNASAAGFTGQDVVDAIIDLVRVGTDEGFDKTGSPLGPSDLVAGSSHAYNGAATEGSYGSMTVGLDALYSAPGFFVAAGIDTHTYSGWLGTDLANVYSYAAENTSAFDDDPAFALPVGASSIAEIEWETPFSDATQGYLSSASLTLLSLTLHGQVVVTGADHPWTLEAWMILPGLDGDPETAFWHRHGDLLVEEAITAEGSFGIDIAIPTTRFPVQPTGADYTEVYNLISAAFPRLNLAHAELADGTLDRSLAVTGSVNDTNRQMAELFMESITAVARPSRVRFRYNVLAPTIDGGVGGLRTRWDRASH